MSEELYREAEFIERCFCEAPGPTRCACCHQPRCAEHLKRALCSRCTIAVGREVRRKASRSWWIGGTAGVLVALVALPFLSAGAIFAGLGVALGGGFGTRRFTRTRAVQTLGRKIPLRGELPAEVEAELEPNTTGQMPGTGF